MRLIEERDLIRRISELPDLRTMSTATIGKIIKECTTIDAVPVIRCLACAWRSVTGFCGRHGHPVNDDFFCAHGTTEIVRKPGPAKKTEKKTEERCGSTGLPCSRCMPGPCDHRRMVIPDGSGQ